MERIVLHRLNHHCEKNKVIPVNQAGFRKGRSTVDHLVKLTTQVKQQFARRKNVLATFFDIKKSLRSSMASSSFNKNKKYWHIGQYVQLFNELSLKQIYSSKSWWLLF